jgi:hypothetical protein
LSAWLLFPFWRVQLTRFQPNDDKPVSSSFTAAIPQVAGVAPSKPNEVLPAVRGCLHPHLLSPSVF